MEVKLPAGSSAPPEAVKAELCGMLSQLKGGQAGLASASRGMAATAPATPTRIDAVTPSSEFARAAEKNDALLPLRYRGKAFSVWG